MSAATVPRSATVGPLRRGLLALLTFGLVAMLVASAWAFAWPSPDVPREVALGQLSEFEPGTVASFTVTSDGVRRLSAAGGYGARPSDYPIDGRNIVHVARLEDGQVRAFSGADIFEARTIVWFPLARTPEVDDESAEPGRFSEPRRGGSWDIEGRWLFGPGPPRLEEFAVATLADGTVIVDVSPILDGDREFVHRGP